MIIVCKSCRASFIVPSSIFAGGAPRTVRCAVCKHVWKEIPPGKHPTTPPPQNKKTEPPLPPKPDIRPADLPPFTHPTTLDTALTGEEGPPKKQQGKTFAEKMEIAKHMASFVLLGLFAIALFSAATFVAGHRIIIQHWPEMQAYYIKLGLAKDPLQNNLLTLQNIASERRYIDGAMQLIVSGEMTSHAAKTQIIPQIAVEAVGPDGRTIESWRIAPPQATITSGTTIPFSASFLSPDQTVVEVNLSFVEPPHDEK